jgi:hypothetical protein
VPGFVNYKKGCIRLSAASDKVYQLLAHGWWFSPGTPLSSTTKTGRHDIAEILLKVALKHQKYKINKINLSEKGRQLVDFSFKKISKVFLIFSAFCFFCNIWR